MSGPKRPPQFPDALPNGWYNFAPDPATDPIFPAAPDPVQVKNDPRNRRWNSLYDLNLLAGSPRYAQREVGVLQKKWQSKFQRNGNGAWDYVEYVPPWTDPDWDHNFIFIEGAQRADVVTAQYAKSGGWQTQRPALLPKDAVLNPTRAAKRWGVYPFQTPGNTNTPDPVGISGLTPTRGGFPLVSYVSDTGQTMTLQLANFESERRGWDQQMELKGEEPSDQGFQDALETVIAQKPEQANLARALLQMQIASEAREDKKEYQALIFGGNTTDELVKKGLWNEDVVAALDLSEPLMELFAIDKWRTMDHRGVEEDEPRFVYNIDGKQGEFTAHNPVVWQALQPALQLLSKLLKANHPIMLAWLDLRKLRPVDDHRDITENAKFKKYMKKPQAKKAGIARAYFFSVWPEFSGLQEDLDDLSKTWDDMRAICRSDFDTSSYAFEILQATVLWEFSSAYQVGLPDISASGSTSLFPNESGTGPPFRIHIEISSNMVWPLLVDEYSATEKAAASFLIANTMLHELCHAFSLARQQMSQPSPPLWLTLNPDWPRQLQEHDAKNGTDILTALQTFGLRTKVDNAYYDKDRVIVSEQVFVEDDTLQEEGMSAEYRFWGGAPGILGDWMVAVTSRLQPPRFLDEVPTQLQLTNKLGQYEMLNEPEESLSGALPLDAFLRLFRSQFWDHAYRRFGPEALRMDTDVITTLWDPFKLSPRFTRISLERYGVAAHEWMNNARSRLGQHDQECGILWQYLFNKWVVRCEPRIVNYYWFRRRQRWQQTDFNHWWNLLAAENSFLAARDAIDLLRPDVVAGEDPLTCPGPPAEIVKRWLVGISKAVRSLNAEAIDFQNYAARLLRLDDGPEKELIFTKYGAQTHLRLHAVYIRICDLYLSWLDTVVDFFGLTPAHEPWMSRDAAFTALLTEDRLLARVRVANLRTHFTAVANVFDRTATNPTTSATTGPSQAQQQQRSRRTRTKEQQLLAHFGTLPSSAAKNAAQRLARLAAAQYARLAPGDPRRKIAEDWDEVLDKGDSLRGSLPAAVVAELAARNAAVGAHVDAQRRAVDAQFPDARGKRRKRERRHGEGTALLQGGQGGVGKGMMPTRAVDDADVQDPVALAALARAGFVRALPEGSLPDGQP